MKQAIQQCYFDPQQQPFFPLRLYHFVIAVQGTPVEKRGERQKRKEKDLSKRTRKIIITIFERMVILPWEYKDGKGVLGLSLQVCQYSKDENRLHLSQD